MEGLIIGGADVRREICVSKSIGLACNGKEIYRFCFVLLVFEGNFPSTSPRGAYIWRGNLTEGFFVAPVWGTYIWRGFFSEFYGIYHSRDNGTLIAILVSTKLKKERKKRKEII